MTKSRARQTADATHRKALNQTKSGEVPKQLDATGAAGISGSGKPSRKPRPKKSTGRTTTTAGKRRSGAQPRASKPAGVAASFAGTCVACERGYPAGAPLGKVPAGWAHAACADAVRERDRILRGETFASQKPSDWRIGKGPSSARVTR
ncbi:hypothetical protein OHB44_33100 (plasmid) [Micromonospora sp. NBC_00821]|uniref:hypothetical protein n=1 Tax=Micromonospora sp. NBC_00821 TaxID=2975977 RepID=UPI002ED4D983|nr:hypothetical protein OHB44_33100 [Micromonospora sp. NBC_00821]